MVKWRVKWIFSRLSQGCSMEDRICGSDWEILGGLFEWIESSRRSVGWQWTFLDISQLIEEERSLSECFWIGST
jgi:hypothetical protein